MLRSPQKFGRLLLVFGLLLSQVSISDVFAQDSKPNRKPTKEVKLKPRADAEVIIPDFTLTLYDDGSRQLSAGMMVPSNELELAYSFEG